MWDPSDARCFSIVQNDIMQVYISENARLGAWLWRVQHCVIYESEKITFHCGTIDVRTIRRAVNEFSRFTANTRLTWWNENDPMSLNYPYAQTTTTQTYIVYSSKAVNIVVQEPNLLMSNVIIRISEQMVCMISSSILSFCYVISVTKFNSMSFCFIFLFFYCIVCTNRQRISDFKF